ncbi:MAG: hypothetical protein KIT72_13130 [Polyangiaceae bacterium]|nr:hypothetical protein [Polyangiaceae bacterium]MCW5791354.1 hypothetical protein [Polyangiaceae bacterium]
MPPSPSAAAEARGAAPATPQPTSPTAAPGAHPEPAEEAPPASPPPTLPAGITVGSVVRLPVPGDAPVLVVHAPAPVRRAAVYLHGVCGDIEAIGAFAEVAAEHFTLVALHADEPCSGAPGRHRWTSDTARQERRIAAALEAVRAAREGHLDTAPRLGIGYSQGALRALALHVRAPELYPRLLLGGLPAAPDAARLDGLQALALVTGEREGHEVVNSALKQVTARGIAAERFVLPRAGHGQYGPEAPRVMGEAIRWVLSSEPDGAEGAPDGS